MVTVYDGLSSSIQNGQTQNGVYTVITTQVDAVSNNEVSGTTKIDIPTAPLGGWSYSWIAHEAIHGRMFIGSGLIQSIQLLRSKGQMERSLKSLVWGLIHMEAKTGTLLCTIKGDSMRLRLRPQSLPKPFPIDMWIKCLT